MAEYASTIDERAIAQELREAQRQEELMEEEEEEEQLLRQRQARARMKKIKKMETPVDKALSRSVINKLWMSMASVVGFFIGFAGLNGLWFGEITGLNSEIKLRWYDKIGLAFLNLIMFFILFAIIALVILLIGILLKFIILYVGSIADSLEATNGIYYIGP